MAEAKKLGELLKETGLIDDFQLESALSHQRNWGGKLGAVLVELEFVKEEDVAKVIAEKLKTPYVDLFDPEIPKSLIELLKGDIAKKYSVIPARREGTTVLIAIADPLDMQALDELRFITGLKIKPALALQSEIELAIKKYYDGETVVRKPRVLPKETAASAASGKMEIIRGSDLNMSKVKQADASNSILSKEESTQQAIMDNKTRMDALISLLIEKGIISRDELVSMVYQKKLGL